MKPASLFSIVVLVALGAMIVSAQPRFPDPQQLAKELKDRLALTDEQHESILMILTDSRKKFTDLRNSSDPGPGMRDAAMKVREETESRILSVLNDSQQEQYMKLQQERRKRMEGRRRR